MGVEAVRESGIERAEFRSEAPVPENRVDLEQARISSGHGVNPPPLPLPDPADFPQRPDSFRARAASSLHHLSMLIDKQADKDDRLVDSLLMMPALAVDLISRPVRALAGLALRRSSNSDILKRMAYDCADQDKYSGSH